MALVDHSPCHNALGGGSGGFILPVGFLAQFNQRLERAVDRCAFDVVEHIQDHHAALREIHRTLLPGGYVYITVPAFMIMWSQHDEINHHQRRYRMPELVQLLEKNGFEVTYRSYFNFWLFLPILFARLLSKLFAKAKGADTNTGSDFETFQNSPINTLFYRVFKSEKNLLRRNFSFPFGVSAMIIGRKSSTPTA